MTRRDESILNLLVECPRWGGSSDLCPQLMEEKKAQLRASTKKALGVIHKSWPISIAEFGMRIAEFKTFEKRHTFLCRMYLPANSQGVRLLSKILTKSRIYDILITAKTPNKGISIWVIARFREARKI